MNFRPDEDDAEMISEHSDSDDDVQVVDVTHEPKKKLTSQQRLVQALQ